MGNRPGHGVAGVLHYSTMHGALKRKYKEKSNPLDMEEEHDLFLELWLQIL
jgi:hypothetical protein